MRQPRVGSPRPDGVIGASCISRIAAGVEGLVVPAKIAPLRSLREGCETAKKYLYE